MELDFEQILSSNNYNSRRNHIIADCPYCSKTEHFYFNVEKALKKVDGKYVYCWDCKKCNRTGNVVKLLKKLGKLNLLEDEYLGDTDILSNPFSKKSSNVVTEDFTPKEIKTPIGFKRVFEDDYLTGERGFTNNEYRKYEVGYTQLYSKLEDYVIILLKEKNKVRGYVARSRLSKREIKQINDKFKAEGLKKKYPRYKNSTNAEFTKLLIGYEEIIFTTKIVILVEGFFDKVRVDQALQLDRNQEMKCCATFGKDISREQVLKLKQTGVRNVILIQDPDAVNHSKELSDRLSKDFKRVFVGYTGNKDLGDSTDEEIINVFDNLKTTLDFRVNIVQKL